MKTKEIPFNKGSVAKKIRSHLNQLDSFEKLPKVTHERAKSLLTSIRKAVDKGAK